MTSPNTSFNPYVTEMENTHFERILKLHLVPAQDFQSQTGNW